MSVRLKSGLQPREILSTYLFIVNNELIEEAPVNILKNKVAFSWMHTIKSHIFKYSTEIISNVCWNSWGTEP